MPADLHVHTNFSDGTKSPAEIVELAKGKGLTAVAITDHDVVAGIAPAERKGAELGIEVVAGIEFTTEAYASEVHILGLFIDYRESRLLEIIQRIQRAREERVYRICERLKAIGLALDPERVFAIAGHRAAGRPHVARALIERGYVKSFKEAFDRYIDFRGPAYVSHYKLAPAEAVALINGAQGLAVFAHPAVSGCDQIIPELTRAGLAGIEAYYSGHGPAETERYLGLAEKHGLLITAGSDYHGEIPGRECGLGETSLSDELYRKLKDEYLRRNKA